jgi:hypothetical protein
LSSRNHFTEIPGHIGPFFPSAFKRIGEYFEPASYSARPLNEPFFGYHAAETGMYFKHVKFNPNFVLKNRVVMNSLRFEYISDTWYRFLCQKGPSKAGTAHKRPPVALYAYTDERPSDEEIEQVGKTLLGLLELDLSHFYPGTAR